MSFMVTRESHPAVWQMLVHTTELMNPNHDPVPEQDAFPVPEEEKWKADNMQQCLGKLSPGELKMIATGNIGEVERYADLHPDFRAAVQSLEPMRQIMWRDLK